MILSAVTVSPAASASRLSLDDLFPGRRPLLQQHPAKKSHHKQLHQEDQHERRQQHQADDVGDSSDNKNLQKQLQQNIQQQQPPPPLLLSSVKVDLEKPIQHQQQQQQPLQQQRQLSVSQLLQSAGLSTENSRQQQQLLAGHFLNLMEELPVPSEFHLRPSQVYPGMGVWSKVKLPAGQKVGPFHGILKPSVEDTSCAWELVDDCGKVKGWLDASEPGSGNWMKLVRSTEEQRQRNLMAVQVDEQVFYKSVRDIHPGEEMLLYAREAVYPELELETLARHSLTGDQSYSCPNCGEVFRSKVAVRRHQTYTCTSTVTPYSSLKEQMGLAQQSLMGANSISSILNNNNSGGGGGGSALGSNNGNRGLSSMNDNSNSNHLSNGADSDDNKSDDNSDSYQEPVESGNGGEFKCEECPKSFQWKANLQRHQLTHDADRKFPCENCDKVFTDPSNLQRHIRSQHVGARSHACSECGKTFATSSGLKQHQHIHSSIKPFQCEVCLKAYTQFSNLCRHKRMHADCRQQIKCKDCGQAFSTVTSLSKHKRFCEGVMRNGMRVIYPSEKLSPMSLSPNGQAPHLNPSLFPSIYAAAAAARPQFPFAPYPPFGTFPGLLPQGLPSMLGNPPVSPSTALKLAANLQQLSPDKKLHLSPDTGSIGSKNSSFSSPQAVDRLARSDPKLSLSDGEVSENSNHSEIDMSNGSDHEGDGSKNLKRKLEESSSSPRAGSPDPGNKEKQSRRESSPSPSREKKTSKEVNIAPPGFTQFRPQSPIVSSIAGSKTSRTSAPSSPRKQDWPFDLSNHGSKSETKASSFSPVKREGTSDGPLSPGEKPPNQKDDAPLDLSTKPIRPVPVLPAEAPRKTHIYGELASSPAPSTSSLPSSPPSASTTAQLSTTASLSIPSVSIPDPKTSVASPFSYPFSPMMMESILRMKEDLKLQQEVASKFANPFARFPMPGPTAFPGLHPHQFSMLPRPEFDKVLSPMMKLDKSSDYPAHPHSHHHHHQPHHHNHHPHHFGPGAPGKSKERYACKFCGKVFPRSANLTRHLRTHTGEQPYKCKYCERSFSISSNLQRHVRNIHNKEKPFKCQLCDRCFGQQTNLDRHLKKHEQEGPHLPDSPSAELEERDEAYFSEIRNFIGTNGKMDDPEVEDEEDEVPVLKDKDSLSDDAEINVDNDLLVSEAVDEQDEEEEEEELGDDVDISDDEVLDGEETPAAKDLKAVADGKAVENEVKEIADDQEKEIKSEEVVKDDNGRS